MKQSDNIFFMVGLTYDDFGELFEALFGRAPPLFSKRLHQNLLMIDSSFSVTKNSKTIFKTFFFIIAMFGSFGTIM